VVYGDLLVVYDLKEIRAKSVKKPSKIPPFAILCGIGDCKAAVFERSFASSEVFELNYADYSVKELPNMLESRSYPGLMHTKATIYVFGGYIDCSYLKKCEKFDQRTAKWTILPDLLTARRIFTLSLYKNCIYLPPIGPPETFEVFSTITDRFIVCPYAGNVEIAGRYWVMSVRNEDKIVLIDRTGEIVGWKPWGSVRVIGKIGEIRPNVSDLCVVREKYVYWAMLSIGKLGRLDLNSIDYSIIDVFS